MSNVFENINNIHFKVLQRTGLGGFFQAESNNWGKVFAMFSISIALPGYIILQSMTFVSPHCFSQVIFHFGVILNLILVLVKLGRVMTIRRKEFIRLFLKVDNFHSTTSRPRQSTKLLTECSSLILRGGFYYTWLMVLTLFSWLLLPLLTSQPILNLLSGHLPNYDDLVANIPTNLPFQFDSPYRELFYFFEIFYTVIVCTYWYAADIIFVSIVIILRAQFVILKNALSQMNQKSEPDDLRLFIQDHQELLKICMLLKKVLSPILFVQMVDSLTIMGCIIFNLTTVPSYLKNKSAVVYFLHYMRTMTYMSSALMGLLMCCWIANETNCANEEIYWAVVESNWYEFPLRMKKDYILILQLGQWKIDFTALGMVKINLPTFVEVLRVSYSYFTIMKQAVDNNNF